MRRFPALLLVLLAATLAAHFPALRDASSRGGGTLLERLLLCAGIAVAGACVAYASSRRHESGAAAFAGGLLFVASSASGSLLYAGSGGALLLGTLLCVLCCGWLPPFRLRTPAIAAAAVAASFALLLLAARLSPELDGGEAGGAGERLGSVSAESARSGFGLFAPTPFLPALSTRLVPLGFLLPIVAALCWGAARLLRAGAVALAAPLLLAQVHLSIRAGGERAALERLLPNPAAAARLAALEGSPAPLEQAVLAGLAGEPAIPAALEEKLGLEAAALHQRTGGDEAALDWLDRWLAARRPAPADRPLPAARASRIRLLLSLRGPEAAAAAVAQEIEWLLDDPRACADVSLRLLEELRRRARSERTVDLLLPLVQRLLARAAASPEVASGGELLGLALLRSGEGRHVEAVRLAELAARREPESARPHVVLARIYLARGEREGGLREIALARRLAPQDPEAQLLEGRILCGSPDFARIGVERMLAAFHAAPQLAGASEEIEEGAAAAAALLGRGQGELARKLVERALDAVGRRPGLVHALGRIAVERRAFEEAAQLLAEAFAAAPERPDLRAELAVALRDAGYGHLLAGDRAGAVERFERALEVAPRDFETAGMQAVVDSFRGGSGAGEDRDVAGARAAFEEAVRLYSGGDREAAKRALQRSIELLPLNPRAHLELGRVELELGQAAAAEGSLRTAIAIGEARSIDVEEAYPILVRALGEQGALPEKLRAVADEYLARYPSGRFRDGLAKLR